MVIDKAKEATHLKVLLWDLDVLNKEAIAMCGVNPRTFYRWLAGESPIPKSVFRMLELELEIREMKRLARPADVD